MGKIKLFVFIFTLPLCSYSQNVFIKRDNKLVDLDQLKNIKIYQLKQSSGKDSVYTIIEPNSLAKNGDTLLVKPFSVEEIHYLDPQNFITIERISKEDSKEIIKIPITDVDKILGKKRSISKPLTIISTLAYMAVATSFVMRMGNSDVREIGTKVFVSSAPVLILCWTLQATVAKKTYYFNRKDKGTWIFN